MAPIEIYGLHMSAPCRIVTMTCEMLGLEYNFNKVDLMAGDHMKPEYLDINPQHNIPAMVDGDFKLNESRAIAAYLANKYGEELESFYPKEAEARAIVDQRMYFDMGSLYNAVWHILHPVIWGEEPAGDKEYDRLKEVLGWLNGWVADGSYAAAGDYLTLADVCLVASYSTVRTADLVDLSEFADAEAWFERCQEEIPNYENANGRGAEMLGAFYKQKSSS